MNTQLTVLISLLLVSLVLISSLTSQCNHRRSHVHCQLQQHSPTLSVPQGDCRAFERLRNQQLKQHRVEISNMMNSNCSKLSLDCSEKAGTLLVLSGQPTPRQALNSNCSKLSPGTVLLRFLIYHSAMGTLPYFSIIRSFEYLL